MKLMYVGPLAKVSIPGVGEVVRGVPFEMDSVVGLSERGDFVAVEDREESSTVVSEVHETVPVAEALVEAPAEQPTEPQE